MMKLSRNVRQEFRQTRRLLFTSSTRAVYEILDPKQTPTSGVAITSRIKKLNFPPFVKVISFQRSLPLDGVSIVFLQDLFFGKFNKSLLNYAEVLNYERHRALGHRINQINEYLGKSISVCLREKCDESDCCV